MRRTSSTSGARPDRSPPSRSLRGVDSPWSASQQAFADAAEWFVATTALVHGLWKDHGLGEWDVRSLVGHTSRSLLTVETYLGRPAEVVEVESAVGYYAATRAAAAGPGVAERGREAGEALGEDPAAAVAHIAARVLPVVTACDGTEVITTIAGGMRLADYLPTRTFELVVHTADLAAAIGVPAEVPPIPAVQALELVSQLAVEGGLAGTLLRAATGREGLPPGFSVL
jgi:Mycothiol maleylpyruvate isomerase N-terminal domain